jgi:flagellar FliL protein
MAQDAKATAKQESKEAPQKSLFKRVLIWSLGMVIMTGGSAGITLYLTGSLNRSVHAQAGASPHASGADERLPAAKSGPPQYVPLEPPIIVNYEDQGMLRYVQFGVTVMTRDKSVVETIMNNMPPIRNNLIMLFGNQEFATLSSTAGKEQLRAQALEEIQTVLREEIGQAGVEAVYFTNFVMQ